MLCTQALLGSAQIIEEGQFIEEVYPRFSEADIAEQGISKITLRKMRKPSGRPIYDDGERIHYHFDTEGHLVHFQMIFPGYRGQLDTTSRRFVYDDDELRSTEIQRGKYRKRIDYARVDDSTVIEERWVRRGNDPWEFLDKEQTVTEERLVNGLTEKTHWIGGIASKPYKSIVEQLNDAALPLSREVWHGARMHVAERWKYRDDGRLMTYEKDNRRDGGSIALTYPADEAEDGQWCEQGNCREWSRVYQDDGLPKGWIFYHTDSENMDIYEFRYLYR